MLTQAVLRRRRRVVEDTVETELLEPGDLLGRARAPDHARPAAARELGGNAAHGTGGTRHEHRFAGGHLADVDDADVGRQPRHPQHAERCRDGCSPRVYGPQAAPIGDGDLTPPEVVHHPGADRPVVVPRGDDLPDRTAREWLAERERRHVRPRVVHPPAHVRVDRDERVADVHLARPGSETSTSASSKSEGTGAPLGREARRISLEWTATSGIVRRFGRYPASRWPFAALTESFKNVVSVPRGSSSCGHRRATHARQEEDARRRRRREIDAPFHHHSDSARRCDRCGLVHASSAGAGDFADEPCANAGGDNYLCPPATAGSSYALDIKLKEPWDDCTEFAVSSGNFPPGLGISNNGNVRGVPTAAGSYTFYLTVSWKTTPPCVSQSPSDRKFTINVSPEVLRAFVATSSLPDANIGQAYTAPALTAANASVSSWTLAGGTLPPGLTLGANGVISGTPTASGLHSFTVQANALAEQRHEAALDLRRRSARAAGARRQEAADHRARCPEPAQRPAHDRRQGRRRSRAGYVFATTGTLPPGLTLDAASGTHHRCRHGCGHVPLDDHRDRSGRGKAVPPVLDHDSPAPRLRQGQGAAAGPGRPLLRSPDPNGGKDARTAFFALAGRIPPGLEVNEVTRRLEGTLPESGDVSAPRVRLLGDRRPDQQVLHDPGSRVAGSLARPGPTRAGENALVRLPAGTAPRVGPVPHRPELPSHGHPAR